MIRKPLIEVIEVGKRGEIVLPRRLRQQLNLQQGDQLVLSVAERRIVLERRGRNLGAYLDVLGSGLADQ